MGCTLEVVALHAADAERAEAGGADRIEVVGSLDNGGMSPEPATVREVRRATSLHLRPLVRLRPGYGTDGGEATRLKGLMSSYLDAGADGMVLGFLNGLGEVDLEVMNELLAESDWPWTYHRAIDACLDTEKAWAAVRTLPRLDQVLTAGSARDVEHGLDYLIQLANADVELARLIMAGGKLSTEHVPWLVRAGVAAFHVGSAVRPQGSWKAYLDPDLVKSWRELLDDESRHARHARPGPTG